MSYEKNSLLLQGIEQLAQPIHLHHQQKLIQYLDLLEKWNKTYNLSAIRKRDEMEVRHILDSLAIVPFLDEYLSKKEALADIGTGAGLPGIVLGILYPETPIYLIECVGKKTAFLQQVVLELQLKNVFVHHQRIQDFSQPLKTSSEPIYHLMSRAFCQLIDFHTWTKHLHYSNQNKNTNTNTIIWAMKAKISIVKEELVPLQKYPHEIIPLKIPFLDEERCLVKMTLQT